METITYPLLIAAFVIATVTDLREQRIPNVLTFPLMLAGLVIHGMAGGLGGLTFAVQGLAVGLVVMLIPYMIGVMGAGDVKLMAATGALLGTTAVLHALLLTSIAGGVYALVVLLRHRDILLAIARRFKTAVFCFMGTRRFTYIPVTQAENGAEASAPKLPRLCYGIAIAAGTTTAMCIGFGMPSLLTLFSAGTA